jgi:hypothetical protein
VQEGAVDGLGEPEHDVTVTALATLAYSNSGFHSTTPGRGAVVFWGLHWLRSRQEEDGRFAAGSTGSWPLPHALATLAMTVDARASGSEPSVRSAQRAIDFAAASLEKEPEAWRSRVGPGGVEPIAWLMLALHAASVAPPSQLTVPADVTARLHDEIGPWTANATVDARLAAGILARLFAGTPRTDAGVLAAAAQCAARPPEWPSPGGDADFTYWYMATNALHQVGGESWKRWNVAMSNSILAHQRMDGTPCHAKGSWDPVDTWSRQGGRVYSTAILALCLEVYYRYDKV